MTTTVPPAAHRAAADLTAVREQWGDLLAAIGQPPVTVWPPRETRAFLDRADDEQHDDAPAPGRVPLTIREHPAPLNVDALDAALAVEGDLFDLADRVAAAVQAPGTDRTDPHRWHLPNARDVLLDRPARGILTTGPDTRTTADRAAQAKYGRRYPRRTTARPSVDRLSVVSAGSRAYGLHWAAVWLEGRALGEQPTGGAPFAPLSARYLDDLAAVAGRARRQVERALGRDGRTVALADPCPWCGGTLTGRTRAGGEPVVVCGTGPGCGAPAEADDRDRRMWRGAGLVGLWSALDARRSAVGA
ncbi:hypothetical protein GT204_07830 [Streptomyces sp. SID4919]|uniref:hypothetical protein n=1 Tax=unclassified Streptomyces TaxID=2593676 RepID=UPI000823ADA2|nr:MULTISPECIES: hypothetical protein [unclassified Streptomyces]MYY08814.1 hypothetical protein [Streptomyces sp. SID4919]SCK25492.1 hypothetical protein YW7DRAFT_01949 [Streptomyces sp. AmelKG-E11A]